jgi:hypothetical protein
MVNIMLKLRTKHFPSSGVAVQARIKSVTTPSPNVYRPVRSGENMGFPLEAMYAPYLAPGSIEANTGGNKNSKNRKRPSNNKRGRDNRSTKDQQNRAIQFEPQPNQRSNEVKAQGAGAPKANNQRRNDDFRQEKSSNSGTVSPSTVIVPSQPQKPPSLGEEEFPTLPLSNPTTTKTVIRVEHPLTIGKNEDDDLLEEDDDDVQSNGKVRCGTFSDSASTTTTSSTSSQSKQSSSWPASVSVSGSNSRSKPSTSSTSRTGVATSTATPSLSMGCYAAALLKKAPVITNNTPKSANGRSVVSKTTDGKSKGAEGQETQQSGPSKWNGKDLPSAATTTKSTKSCWGGTATGAKTSFADILRKENAGVAAGK